MSAPTPLRVRLPFRSEDEFAAQYGAHVGRDGFFLATRAPKPVGMQLLFDLVLADGSSLLRGEGVVVRSSATGDRPGMTVRFVRLESAGKALVDRIVSGRPARGAAPAEAQAHPSAWAPPAGPSAAPSTAPRETLSRPAHREAWAPPEGPTRGTGRPATEARSTPSRPADKTAPPAELGWAEAEPVEAPPATDADAPPASASLEVTGGAAAETPGDVASPVPSEPSADSTAGVPLAAAPAPAGAEARGAIPPATETSDAEVSASPSDAVAGVAAPVTTEPSPESSGSPMEDTSRWGTSAAPSPGESPAPEAAEARAAALTPSPPLPARVEGLDAPASPASEPDRAASDEERPAGAAPHPPLDDSELPELVVTEFKGPGRRRPGGLEHTPASADVHAAITPPAGTLLATELDEPPPEPGPRFQLDAPVRGDEPLQTPESSFHDVAQALGGPASARATPIRLLPSMETAAPDEVPIPPPPPVDQAPVLEEGAVRIEAEPAVPPAVGAGTQASPEAAEREPAAPLAVAGTGPIPLPAPELSTVEPTAAPAQAPEVGAAAQTRTAAAGVAELGVELNPESIRVSWFHDGRAEPLVLDAAGGRVEMPVRLVREAGAPPRLLPPDAADPAAWVGAPLPFLGVRADSDASRTLARRWPAALVPDDRGESAFALEGGTVRATELVATLLRWVRHRVEELTSREAMRAVLTVPVAFNTLQRERLREAAERAGFEAVRLVQAPTAATMAFAHGRGLARRRILVWRMGASSCDIAVLAAAGDDLDMVACAGDAALGTVNFDEQIALALDKSARGDAAVLRKRIAEAAQLRAQLEDAALSEASLESGARLSRNELEVRTTALVERGVLLAREVLRSASLTPEALDELVLVGAAARLPHVRRMVEEAMGRTARTDVDLAAAPSLGAATLSHLLVAAGPKSASRTALHEVLGVPLEIVTPELGQVRVLDRNTRLPAEKTLTLTLGLGTPLEVQVFQGPARAPDPRSFLGLLRAPADRAGDWTLHLSLDTDGVLRAAATNPSGKRLPLQLQTPVAGAQSEAPVPQRVPSEPEAPVAPPKQDTGVLGGLRRLFGRR